MIEKITDETNIIPVVTDGTAVIARKKIIVFHHALAYFPRAIRSFTLSATNMPVIPANAAITTRNATTLKVGLSDKFTNSDNAMTVPFAK